MRMSLDGHTIMVDRPEFFELMRRQLEPTLRSLGFQLAVERYDRAAFGSACAEYRRRGAELRLVWDGKEGALWAESRPGPAESWRDVETQTTGGRPALDKADDQARVARLRNAIELIYRAV